MFQNYLVNLKTINKQFFSYCLIFVLFAECCICTTYDNTYFSGLEDEKTISINAEEIIRRQNIAKNYLKEKKSDAEKDWIETYHGSFSGSSAFNSKKTVPESSLENEHEGHVMYPLHNDDLHSLKNLDESFNFYSEKNSDANRKDETALLKKENGKILQEYFTTDKNGNENPHSQKHNNEDIPNVSLESSESSKAASKYTEKGYIKSKSNNLQKHSLKYELPKGSNLYPNIKHFNIVKNDFRFDELKNISVNTNKIIQIMIRSSEFTTEDYFINGETLTLTEFYKLQKHLTSLSFLQKSKNNVYSVNRLNIVDSIGKVKPLFKQNKCTEEKLQQMCKVSKCDTDITSEIGNCKYSSFKKSAVDFVKRISPKVEHEEIAIKKNNKDMSVFENKKILTDILEKVDRGYHSYDSEILRRKKLMNSFVNTLGNNQENWIESYHLNNVKNKFHSESTFNLQKTSEQTDVFPKEHSQERQYIIRWINKLQNKMKDSHFGYHSLSILVSADFYKILGELSQEFDIVIFDELVNNMISNATLHNYATTFDYKHYFNNIHLVYNNKILTCIFIFLFSYILVFCVLYKTTLYNDFALHKVILTFVKHYKWVFFIILLIFTFYWHGYKMYQQKIAEKHSVMSRVVPSYCESILVKESGALAHFKEYFRNLWYDEDCKKYYEAVMVDPSSEITVFSISVDLVSEATFQMLQPVARNINSFFKVLTYGLYFPQKILISIIALFIIVIFLCFVLSFFAFKRSYKVNFPFNLGSVEPTALNKGSRVEEIEEKETSLKDFSLGCDALIVNYNNKTESENYAEDVFSKENVTKIKPKPFQIDSSKHCVSKVKRIRRNSI